MKIKIIFILLFCLILFLFFSINKKSDQLEVYFLDVGQGDAILIRTPQGQNILIDGGPDNILLYKLSQALPWWDRTIDYMIISHYHADHYMAFPEILNKYKVKNILVTSHQPNDSLYTVWQESLSDKNVSSQIVKAGEIFRIDDDLSWRVISADFKHEDFNDNSLVIRLSYREINFLFMGDLPTSGEERISKFDFDLESEVLKVGHHGSKYSSSDIFLSQVKPQLCIIQSGEDNKFGHPHKEAVARLESVGCKVKNTQNLGTISLKTDGHELYYDF
ncbi:hypothetical protein C0580_01855 [Candidatus Parcubacteria bacterium]|nr:MAG: hypothetical protein C0580_01855 [Candidatus Parcubacteria bacterium]